MPEKVGGKLAMAGKFPIQFNGYIFSGLDLALICISGVNFLVTLIILSRLLYGV